MLTDEQCKNLLEKNGNKYSIEETRVIKEFFLMILELHLEQVIKNNEYEEGSINVEGIE